MSHMFSKLRNRFSALTSTAKKQEKLVKAIREGNLKKVKALLAALDNKHNKNNNKNNNTALTNNANTAAAAAATTTVIDVNYKHDDLERGRTPLLTAARYGHADIMLLLLDYGACIDDVSAHSGESALHIAAWNGFVVVAQVVIRKQPNCAVHWKNVNGQTPLHHAITKGRITMVRLLIQAGAKDTARDNMYETPLDYLQQRPRTSKTRQELQKVLDKEKPHMPDTLLTIFFCKSDYNNVPIWFDRMADAVQNVHECRLFYTILRAALALQILPRSSAQAWAQKVLGQTALRSKSPVSLNLLFLIVAKAFRDDMISEALYTKLNHYRKLKDGKGQTTKAGISPDIRWTIKQSATLMNGLEGTPSAVGLGLRFLFARMDLLRQTALQHGFIQQQLQTVQENANAVASLKKDSTGGGGGDSTEGGGGGGGSSADGVESLDSSDAPLSQRFRKAREYAASTVSMTHTLASNKSELSQSSQKLEKLLHRARIESMVGFLGVVLNSILMGVETYGASLNHLLQYVVDFGDPVHVQKVIATEFEYDKATALRKHVSYGVSVAKRVAQIKIRPSSSNESVVQQAEEYLQVIIARKDPLVNLGFCTVIFDAAKKIDAGAGRHGHEGHAGGALLPDDQHRENDDWDVLSKLSSDLEIISTVSPLPSIGSADYTRQDVPPPPPLPPPKRNGSKTTVSFR